ncbi:MAG: hypothetical protein KDD66_15645 [Bdellovibrionales bacterium]|nr:hypothetical protein [Bdellovibrionales bacterium]
MSYKYFLRATLCLVCFITFAPSLSFARTFTCYCVDKSNHTVHPFEVTGVRCGIDANKKATEECKKLKYSRGTCTDWKDDYSCQVESSEEDLLLEILLLEVDN